ncbi:MAG: aquaporin Z [Burkholderiaceae bacterium]
MRALCAEIFGTFWLVLGGCGAAVFAAAYGVADNGSSLGLGFLGVSFAFGLTVLTGAYAVGHVSGGHFNPAVTLGLLFGGRFPISKVPGYIIAQVIGGVLAAWVIFLIASGQPEFAIKPGAGTFATNGFGAEGSPGGYSMMAALLAEVITTAAFLIVIMGATAKRAAAGFAGLSIGMMLALIHMVTIPITNTSVNPARSTGPALISSMFGEGVTVPMEQLWFFWAAPIAGAVIGALIYRTLIDSNND